MQPKRSLCKGSHLRLATQTQKKKKTELKSQALIEVAFLITQSTFIFPIKKGGKTICKEVHFTPVKEENKLSWHKNKLKGRNASRRWHHRAGQTSVWQWISLSVPAVAWDCGNSKRLWRWLLLKITKWPSRGALRSTTPVILFFIPHYLWGAVLSPSKTMLKMQDKMAFQITAWTRVDCKSLSTLLHFQQKSWETRGRAEPR